MVAEYWLETEAPRVVAVVETESMEPFGQIRMDWGDMFEIEREVARSEDARRFV